MNTMVKLNLHIKNNTSDYNNTIKEAYATKPVQVKFYAPNPQVKFIEDESIFVIGTNLIIADDNTCFLNIEDDMNSRLKSFILQNVSKLVLSMELEYKYEDNKCYIDYIKSAEVIFKDDTNIICKEWTEIDSMKQIKCVCSKCHRPFEISIRRPEYKCSCENEYKIENMHNVFYGSGYKVKNVSKI